jgi:putative ABC transport system permease protein
MRTPITNFGMNGLTFPEGYQAKSRMDTLAWLNLISPEYFNTMATRLVMGRDFAKTDDVKTSRVMIIGESTARHFFGTSNPVGKTIGMDTRGDKRVHYEIVGVVEDTKYQQINEAQRLTAFLPVDQDPEPDSAVNFEIRRAVPLNALLHPVQSAISSVNRDVSLEFQDFETQVNESLLQPRVVALLSSAFGLLALLLAGIGLYGLTAYGVSRRKNEIGIRIALGARRGAVIRLILGDVAMLLALGVSAGVGASLVMGRLIANLLYGIRPNDPMEIGVAVLILTACTVFAAYIPARRAAGLDPMGALREE